MDARLAEQAMPAACCSGSTVQPRGLGVCEVCQQHPKQNEGCASSSDFAAPMAVLLSLSALKLWASCMFQYLRFVIASMDMTLWPANSPYVTAALDHLATVLNMSSNNVGHVQCPVVQAQTTVQAALKHKRSLEDHLMSRHLDLSRSLTLVYKKQETSQRNDRRQMTQAAYIVTSEHTKSGAWQQSEALQTGVISDLPLIKVVDMRGYDPDNKPGPAARTEQILPRSTLGHGAA